MRQGRSLPLLAELKDFRAAGLASINRKRSLAGAIRYSLSRLCPDCGGTALTRLGEDEREVLEYLPSHFKVVVHVRPKLSCRQCETITQAPAPSLPIERGRPDPSLLAHVAK